MLRTIVLSFLMWVTGAMGGISQSVPTARPQTRVTLPGPQKHGPPSQPAPFPGTIEGFVYWDTASVSHVPGSSCSGLAVTVAVGDSSAGKSTSYKSLATLTNNFQYVGQVKQFLVGGKIKVYDVCTYGYDHVPVGADLRVTVLAEGSSPTQAGPFSPASVPQVDPVGPITIINGQCNMLPRITNPTASDLTAHWGSCQNMAYDVNFMMQPAQQVLNSRGTGVSSGAGTQTGMLASKPQQGMLTNNSGTLLGNHQSTAEQVAGVQSSGSKVELNPQPFPPRAAATGATVTPGANASLNPQPFPPGPAGREAAPKATLPGNRRVAMTLAPPKQGSRISNPKSALQDAAIIAVLQKQSQNAAAEASAVKLGILPAGVQTGSAPLQTMAATGTGSRGGAPGANQNRAIASSMKRPPLGAALPGQFNNLALTCSHDPSLRALTVNGGPGPAIFTPDPKYNFYTITGCSFGSPGTNSKAYIYYQGTFREDFQIQQWTDNFIQLSLDQNISGLDDQNNVTLVIQRDDGKQWTKNSYRFYAARQTILLPSIPQSDFSLNNFRLDNTVTKTWTPIYTSASTASVVPNLPGMSAEVHWDITTDPKGSLVGGNDLYDFSHLHSTFALDSTSMAWRDVSCTDPNYNQFASSKGNWSIDWYGASGIQVGWQGQICNPTWHSCGNNGVGFKSDCFVGAPESNYGIDVWVTGPRGIDPWSGKPMS